MLYTHWSITLDIDWPLHNHCQLTNSSAMRKTGLLHNHSELTHSSTISRTGALHSRWDLYITHEKDWTSAYPLGTNWSITHEKYHASTSSCLPPNLCYGIRRLNVGRPIPWQASSVFTWMVVWKHPSSTMSITSSYFLIGALELELVMRGRGPTYMPAMTSQSFVHPVPRCGVGLFFCFLCHCSADR